MPEKTAVTTFVDAIRDGTAEAMRDDPSIVVYGLGVNDPGRVFGTTAGLLEEFGPSRVFETPTSENAMTGIAVGAALGGLKPIVTHQRFDFFLLAMDQLVNSAAKWRYMFGGQFQVPMVIRLITGRGWGQGPTHSQSYHSWLANVPGLKVVMPSSPEDAKVLLRASIDDPNPVVFIENRPLHGLAGGVRKNVAIEKLGRAKVVRAGQHVTVVGFGNGIVESMRAAIALELLGISSEVIDLRTIYPLDYETLVQSATKTGAILVVDYAPASGSLASSITAELMSRLSHAGRISVGRLAGIDLPEPTSHGPVTGFHVDAGAIFTAISGLLGEDLTLPDTLQGPPTGLDRSGNAGPF